MIEQKKRTEMKTEARNKSFTGRLIRRTSRNLPDSFNKTFYKGKTSQSPTKFQSSKRTLTNSAKHNTNVESSRGGKNTNNSGLFLQTATTMFNDVHPNFKMSN